MKKKTLIRILSYLLSAAIVLTSSSVTSFAESVETSDEEITAETAKDAPLQVSGNDETVSYDITGNDEVIIVDVTGNDEEETEEIGEEIEEEIIEDVSCGEEAVYNDSEITGTIAVKIGNTTKQYKNADIITGISSLVGVSSATVTLKSNIVTNVCFNINSGKVTLDLGKFSIKSTKTDAPVIKTLGTTELTVKGSGTIESVNEASTKSNSGAINVGASSKAIILSGTIKAAVGITVHGVAASLTIKGGKIYANTMAILARDNSNIEISGGTIQGVTSAIDIEGENAVVRIKGGNISSKNTEKSIGISVTEGHLIVSGGTISSSANIAYGIYLDNTDPVNYDLGKVEISGGKISVSGTDCAAGICPNGNFGKVRLSGGTFDVRAVSSAFGINVTDGFTSQMNEEHYIYFVGGTMNVVTTGENSIACGISFESYSTVVMNGLAKITADGATTIGASIDEAGSNLKMVLGDFVLGSSKANSIDNVVYGIVVEGGSFEATGGNISISSSASEIYGIRANSLKRTIKGLTISVNATNATKVYGISQEVGFSPIVSHDMQIENTTIKISGNITESKGINSSRTTGSYSANDTYTISGCTISVTSNKKDTELISGIYLNNSYNTSSNTSEMNLKLLNSDITVSAGKNATSTDAGVAAVYAENIYASDIVCSGNNLNVSTGEMITEEAAGFYLDCMNYKDDVNIDFSSNTISVKGGKIIDAAYGINVSYGAYLTDACKRTYLLENNNIAVSNPASKGSAIELTGDSAVIKGNIISYSGNKNINGINASFNDIKVSGSKISVSGKADSCFGIRLHEVTDVEEEKAIVENCTISLKVSDGTYLSAGILSTAYALRINDSSINSDKSGLYISKAIDVYLNNSNIKSKEWCVYGTLFCPGMIYAEPENVLECTGDKAVINQGYSFGFYQMDGCNFYNKAGEKIEAADAGLEKYVKMRDDLPVKVKLVNEGLDGCNLLSKQGSVRVDITLPEGYELIEEGANRTIYRWFTNEDMIGTSNSIFGAAVGNVGTHHISVGMDVYYKKSGDAGATAIKRTIILEKDIVVNPEVTLYSYGRWEDPATGGTFENGSKEKTVAVALDSLFTQTVEVNKDGYLLAGWTESTPWESYQRTYFKAPVTENMALYAYWVPDGLYIVDKETKMPITTLNEDGKSIQLKDEQYTGLSIKPNYYEVYYGLVPLADYYTHATMDEVYIYAGTIKTTYKNCTNPGVGIITIQSKVKKYKGSLTLKFNIKESHFATTASDNLKYTGKAISYTPSDIYHKEIYTASGDTKRVQLRKGTDYSLSYQYENNGSNWVSVKEIKKAGNYRVTVKGKGGFKGESTINVTVSGGITKLTPDMVSVEDHEWISFLVPYTPGYGDYASALKVENNGATVAKTEYEVFWRLKGSKDLLTATEVVSAQNKTAFAKVGTYEVVVKGKGDFEGTVVKPYKITGIDISQWKPVFKKDITSVTAAPNVWYIDAFDISGFEDAQGNFYSASDINYNKSFAVGKSKYLMYDYLHAGKTTISFTGEGKYYGKITTTVKVKTFNIAEAYKTEKIKASYNATQAYYPGGVKPEVVLKYGEGTANPKYLKVSYKNNKKVGKASVTIKGKGDYTGSITIPFNIVPSNMNNTDVTLLDRGPSKKAGDYKTTVKLSDKNGKSALKSGTDYTLSYYDEKGKILDKKSKISAGQVITVQITGKGNYRGVKTTDFKVGRTNISEATASIKDQVIKEIYVGYGYNMQYSNQYVQLTSNDITIKHKTFGKLEYGKDYIIVGYSNNTAVGTARVTVQGIGDYSGTKTVSFKIKTADISQKTTAYAY